MIVRGIVHEMVTFGVLIEILHLALIYVGLVDLVAGRDRLFRHVSVEHVTDLSAGERAALAGAHMLEIHDFVRNAVNLKLETFSELVSSVHRD